VAFDWISSGEIRNFFVFGCHFSGLMNQMVIGVGRSICCLSNIIMRYSNLIVVFVDCIQIRIRAKSKAWGRDWFACQAESEGLEIVFKPAI
jgi:hypothetical protein